MELLLPAAAATRWLLLADLACLIAVGLAVRRPLVGVTLALGGGFLVLNGLGMALTDFYMGLALFHLAAGLTGLLFARGARWIGAVTLVLAVGLGALT